MGGDISVRHTGSISAWKKHGGRERDHIECRLK